MTDPCCASRHDPPDTACKTWEPSGGGGKHCVYCDHEEKCHPGSGGTCWVFRPEEDESALEDQIASIYIGMDALFRAEEFAEAERLMREISRGDTSLEVLLALLSISSPVPAAHVGITELRAELASRTRSMARSDEHADDLLRGLI